MEHSLIPEIAQAIAKGERDYAELLRDLDLVRPGKTEVIHVNDLNENLKQGYNDLERRLRGAL